MRKCGGSFRIQHFFHGFPRELLVKLRAVRARVSDKRFFGIYLRKRLDVYFHLHAVRRHDKRHHVVVSDGFEEGAFDRQSALGKRIILRGKNRISVFDRADRRRVIHGHGKIFVRSQGIFQSVSICDGRRNVRTGSESKLAQAKRKIRDRRRF